MGNITDAGGTSNITVEIPGATDTHLHIFEPGYPLNPTVPTRAEPEAGLAEYRVEMARLGLSRAVIVQPSAYGTDNRCTLAAMAALGTGARGVAILPEDITDVNISLLAALGMRGLRCLLDQPGGMMTWERTVRMAPRFVEHGWHINLQFSGREFPERAVTIHVPAWNHRHRPSRKIRRGFGTGWTILHRPAPPVGYRTGMGKALSPLPRGPQRAA